MKPEAKSAEAPEVLAQLQQLPIMAVPPDRRSGGSRPGSPGRTAAQAVARLRRGGPSGRPSAACDLSLPLRVVAAGAGLAGYERSRIESI